MIVDRSLLESKLKSALREYSQNRNFKASIFEIMKTKGFKLSDVNDFIFMNTPMETFSFIVLCLFTIALFDVTKSEALNPAKFFYPIEIEEAQKYEIENIDTSNDPLIFTDMIQINENQWAGKLSIQEFNEKIDTQRIQYNPETQRGLKLKEYKGSIISEISTNKESVRSIKDDILNNRFVSNFITLNIEQNGKEDFNYNTKSRTLIITDGDIALTDGWHRSLGMIQALKENKNINYTTGIMITHFDISKAQNFIVQEDKRNKINTNYIKTIDNNNFSNQLVKKLNEHPSYLKEKIVNDEAFIKNSQGLILYPRLLKMINYTFNPQNNMDMIKQSKFIIDGLNMLIESNPDYLIETNESLWFSAIVKLYNLYVQSKPSTDLVITQNDLTRIIYATITKAFANNFKEVVTHE
ncbi:MAG TPA: hypothetical protein VIK86_04670 [Candidatus Paceibacterota bacterium]